MSNVINMNFQDTIFSQWEEAVDKESAEKTLAFKYFNGNLSCVNIWEALSASTKELNGTAFTTVSSDTPVLVNFTVNSPLSVFSVSAISGAMQCEPDHPLSFSNNKLNIIV